MKISLKALLLATAFTSTGALADECNLGEMPTLPNGATASMEEMVAGQQSIKAFQAEAQAYRTCLDEGMAAIKEAATDGDKESAEEAIASDFNAQIRAYKAANPS